MRKAAFAAIAAALGSFTVGSLTQRASGAIIASDAYSVPPYSEGGQIESGANGSDGTQINGGSGFLSQDIDNGFKTNVTVMNQALTINGAGNSNSLVIRDITDIPAGT